MKKKIIYISILPLDKNNYERFGIEKLLKDKWDVEYWIYFGKHSNFFKYKDLFYKKEKNFLVFESLLQIIKKVKNLESKKFYFKNIGQPWYIERILSIKGGKKIVLDTVSYPEVYNVTLRKFFLEKITFEKIFNFLPKIINIIKKKITGKLEVKPSYIFTAGFKSLYFDGNFAGSKSKKVKIVNSHSLDYERYLEYKKNSSDKNYENSIVYIDQHVEGNYELLLSNENAVAASKSHWRSINNFLNNLNSKLDKKVIIAAHPKRDKNDRKDLDYEIIYNQTANLIKNSSLVVGHNSTAVSLVVLFKKPYTCITTDELMKNPYFYFSLKKYSEELGTKLINIDHFKDYNFHDFLKYDENLYKTYIENYVKTPDVKSEGFWSDFIDFFENEN